MEIRFAEEKDFLQLFEIIKEFALYMKKPDQVTITLDQMIRNKSSFGCLIACEGDEILGYAVYFYGWYSWTGKSLYIDDLYVREKFRGKKIGTQLLDRLTEIAKQENCTKMRWQVADWNTNAIEFYRKRGAEFDEVERNCDLKLINLP
jgi:diamine N-acetyltransferase